MGTGPRQLRAANLGFGKWLQRGTERGEPEGRRPCGWGSSLLSLQGARWQWSRPGTARFPAAWLSGARAAGAAAAGGAPGPLARKIRWYGGGRESPAISGTFASSHIQKAGIDCNPVSVRADCVRREEGSLALLRAKAGCWLRRRDAVPPGDWIGLSESCFGGRITVLALPN